MTRTALICLLLLAACGADGAPSPPESAGMPGSTIPPGLPGAPTPAGPPGAAPDAAAAYPASATITVGLAP